MSFFKLNFTLFNSQYYPNNIVYFRWILGQFLKNWARFFKWSANPQGTIHWRRETERIQKSQERKQKLFTYYKRESSQQFCRIEANSSIERDGSSEDDTVRVEKDSCIERDGSSEDDTVCVEKDSCERNYTPVPSIAEAADRF